MLYPKEMLELLFNPRSIAIAGASGKISDIYDVTTAPMVYLLKYGYRGKIFPINPKYSEIHGFQCYPSLSAIPDEVDVALVLLPANRVLEFLEECGNKGVKGVIITSSGFAETGEQGRLNQERIKELAEKYKYVVLGPNCNGLVNVHKGIAITFTPVLEDPKIMPGEIGFVSGSGATLSAIGARAKEWGVNFSYLIGTGNEADLDLVDCIRYIIEDPQTKVVMALIEGLKDGRKFLDVADSAFKKKKPIVALKLGQSEAGRKMASSHTGKLAGSAKVNQAAFKQKGVLTVDEINNFILSAQIFLQAPLPQGDGIGIISTSGGSAGLAADLVEKKGLRLGELSHKSLEELSGIIRWFSTAKNPFDFAGQVLRDETFARKVYDIFLRDPDIGLLILVMTPMQFFDKPLISQAIKAGKDNQKPVIILYEGGKLDPDTEGIIKNSNTPFFTSPRECIEVIGNLIRYSQFIERDKSILETINIPAGAKEKVLSVINKSGGQMVEREAKEVISHYGIPITEQKLATSLEEALAAAASIGYPVALKVESTNVLHKSDVGGVELNINNDEELKKAYEGMLKRVQMTLPNVKIRGVLIQEMVRDKGVEVIVGVTRDPQFGPTLMFGLGGVFVEALEDISFRICPINLMDAKEMVREIKGYKLLEGFRGSPQADIKVLEEVLVKFSKLAMEFEPAIKEIEINPLLVLPVGRGVKALDARVALC